MERVKEYFPLILIAVGILIFLIDKEIDRRYEAIDQEVGLVCKRDDSEKIMRFILQSSKQSREHENYYKIAQVVKTNTSLGEPTILNRDISKTTSMMLYLDPLMIRGLDTNYIVLGNEEYGEHLINRETLVTIFNGRRYKCEFLSPSTIRKEIEESNSRREKLNKI